MYLLGNALITILVNLVTVHTYPGGGGVGCVGKFACPNNPSGIIVHTGPNIFSLHSDSPYNSCHNAYWYICSYMSKYMQSSI